MAGTFELLRQSKRKLRITACAHVNAEKLLRPHVASVAETLAMLRANPLGVVRIDEDTLIRYNPRDDGAPVRSERTVGEYPPREATP
jgi:hypothetical protein